MKHIEEIHETKLRELIEIAYVVCFGRKVTLDEIEKYKIILNGESKK